MAKGDFQTEVTSVSLDGKIYPVSVSKEFRFFINKYHISPSDAFRKGVAVCLCELGIRPYNNPLNQERIKNADEFIKEVQKNTEYKIKLMQARNLFKQLVEL